MRQYCRNTETKDQARMYQFMRDLIACRDWYDRDSGCILSRDELCDVINFLAVNWCMFPFIACFLYFWVSHVFFIFILFIILYYMYNFIIKLYFNIKDTISQEIFLQSRPHTIPWPKKFVTQMLTLICLC